MGKIQNIKENSTNLSTPRKTFPILRSPNWNRRELAGVYIPSGNCRERVTGWASGKHCGTRYIRLPAGHVAGWWLRNGVGDGSRGGDASSWAWLMTWLDSIGSLFGIRVGLVVLWSGVVSEVCRSHQKSNHFISYLIILFTIL